MHSDNSACGLQRRHGPLKDAIAIKLHLQPAVVTAGLSRPFIAGVGPTKFTTSLNFAKTAKGRIAVDSSLRVLQVARSPGAEEQPRRPEDVSISGK